MQEHRGGSWKPTDWGSLRENVCRLLPAEAVGTGREGQPPFGAALRLGQALLFLQVFEAIHSACLTLKLFATVLLHSVGVLLQSGVHAM